MKSLKLGKNSILLNSSTFEAWINKRVKNIRVRIYNKKKKKIELFFMIKRENVRLVGDFGVF